MKALQDRVSYPHKFSAGRKYLALHNQNAPLKVMELLGFSVPRSESPQSVAEGDSDIMDSSEFVPISESQDSGAASSACVGISVSQSRVSETLTQPISASQSRALQPLISAEVLPAGLPLSATALPPSQGVASALTSAPKVLAHKPPSAESPHLSRISPISGVPAQDSAESEHTKAPPESEICISETRPISAESSERANSAESFPTTTGKLTASFKTRSGKGKDKSALAALQSLIRSTPESDGDDLEYLSGEEFVGQWNPPVPHRLHKAVPALDFVSPQPVRTKAARKIRSAVVIPEVPTQEPQDSAEDLVPISQKRHTKRSASESEDSSSHSPSTSKKSKRHKKKKRHHKHRSNVEHSDPYYIERSEGRVSISEEGFNALLQKFLETHTSTSSEEENVSSVSNTWKSYRELVLDVHPETVLPERPKSVFKTAAGAPELTSEPHKLPLFPETAASIKVCEQGIKQYLTKRNTTPAPLQVGEFFPGPSDFHTRFWEASEGILFNTPASKPHSLARDILPSGPSETKPIAFLSDKDLKEQEKVCRENISLWSLFRWGHSVLESLQDLDSLDDLKEHLQTVLNQFSKMSPQLEERLMQQFTNIILRRRDAFLHQKGTQKLQDATVQQLRASPLAGPELFSLPPEILAQEQELKSNRTFLSRMLQGVRAAATPAPRPRIPAARPSAAAGSAAQLAQAQPAQAQQVLEAAPWPTQGTSGFRARRPPSKATRGRGGKKAASSFPARGKAPFPRGRGGRQ